MNDNGTLNFDWAGQTILHPLALAAVIVLGVATMVLPRRWALIPLILMACFIAPAQRVAIFSLNFTLLRLMVLAGWTRLLLRNETRGVTIKTIDLALVAWAVSGTIVYTLLFGSFEALKYRLGTSFDAVGMYFLFRCLIRDWDDLDAVVRGFSYVAVPVAVAFAVEHATGRNIFAIFGYVPQETLVREGRLRCQGAFAHPILAGCFWAALMPLIAARAWAGRRERRQTILGLLAAATIIVFCASSTPIVAVALGLIGAAFFPLRHRMRWVCWGLLLVLVELHLVMRAPVWHLIARGDVIGGSTGWHRYFLINEAINRFDEWWLLGTTSTDHWGRGLFDLTNQYVLEGVRGGVITLVLFLAVIALAFRDIGRLWRAVADDKPRRIMAWALGVALLIHCGNFIAVSYFGQIYLIWYLLLAVIASLAPAALCPQRASPPRQWGVRVSTNRSRVNNLYGQ